MILLIALATVLQAGTHFTCTPVRVWDGDGPIWCAEGPKVRLAAIGAREIDGRCRRRQPCPRPSGIAARDSLVQLLGGARGRSPTGHIIVRGPRLSCVSDGSGKGDRTAAWCSAPVIGDLSCAQVRRGVALPWAWFGGDRVCRR